MKNLFLFTTLCLLSLVGCKQTTKNQVINTHAEKIVLCEKASDIYIKNHPKYAHLTLKSHHVDTLEDGNTLVKLTFQPELNSFEFRIIGKNTPKLVLSCQFNNDYEYRFLTPDLAVE